MNKYLLRASLGFMLLFQTAVLSAQTFEELNQYKYFLVEAQNPNYHHSPYIKSTIERLLSLSDIPIYHSREDLANLNAQECEILQVRFQAITGEVTVVPFAEVTIQMYNCQNRLLYSFQDRKTSAFSFIDPTYEKMAYEKAIEKALKPIRRYYYRYNPNGNPQPKQDTKPVLTEAFPESDVDINIPKAKDKNPLGVAVIIGNKDYQDKDIPSVDYALHDARTLRRYLIESFGFLEENILYYENASQADFNALFGTSTNPKGLLNNYVKPGESDVFIFYSGHGMPDIEQKTGYFVPVDGHVSVISLNGYALNTFYENLSQMPYRSLTVLIDACFSGASEKGSLIQQASPIYIKTKNKVISRENTLVFLSSTGDQISSWYPEKNHSLFTYYFLKGIQGEANENQDKKLTLAELKEYIDKEVIYKARRLHNRTQTPEIYGSEQMTVLDY